MGVDTDKFSSGFNKYCFNKIEEIKVYLGKHKDTLNSNNKIVKEPNSLTKNQIHDYYFKEIINIMDVNDIVNIMLYTLFRIVTHNDIIIIDDMGDEDLQTSLLQNGIKIGKYISNIYIRFFYKEYLNNNDNISFSMFKKGFISQDRYNILVDDEFYLYIGGKLIEIMTTCNMLEVKIIKNQDNSIAILKISEEVSLL